MHYIYRMNTAETARCLSELGHVTRLQIYRFMVRQGKSVPVGTIQEELDIPGSTLSHHIGRLTKAGLITQKRDGRMLYCSPRLNRLQSIIDYLAAECCGGKGCIEVRGTNKKMQIE